MNTRLAKLKERRRERLAALLDRYGQTELGKLTGIDQTYLWQMGKGEGKSRRGINDENAAKIEAGLGLEPGSLDHDEADGQVTGYRVQDAPHTPSQPARPDPLTLAQTQDFLETAFAFQGKAFVMQTDADLFADAYVWLAEDERPADQRNLVHFGHWLAARQAKEERNEHEGSGSTGKVAGKNQRRAGRAS